MIRIKIEYEISGAFVTWVLIAALMMSFLAAFMLGFHHAGAFNDNNVHQAHIAQIYALALAFFSALLWSVSAVQPLIDETGTFFLAVYSGLAATFAVGAAGYAIDLNTLMFISAKIAGLH